MKREKQDNIKSKVCAKCGVEKPINNFTFRKDQGTYRSICHECRRNEYRTNEKIREIVIQRAKKYYAENREKVLERSKQYYNNNLEKILWGNARIRAKKKNLPFNIEIADIVIPDTCPVLGIPIAKGKDKPTANSPTIDRVIPERGYVKGNIVVVSHKANTIKNDASIDELRKVLSFYEEWLSRKEW
jgi:hypothetical protein